MASINYAAREINVKIVYYGPGLSGKTTNLQIIHRKVPPEFKSDMVSLATETDRTLFFDFLPLDLGKIKGFSTKFQLYTVPGQVYYNATRKLVLRGVDGVVFVADSGSDKIEENLESFQNLEENLAEYGYKRENIPIILQYNKRDVPNALSVEELDQHINKYNLPWGEAIANKGVGVFDSLKLIGKIVIDYLNKKYSRGGRSPTARPVPPAQATPRMQQPSPTAPSSYNQLRQPPPGAPMQPPGRSPLQQAPRQQQSVGRPAMMPPAVPKQHFAAPRQQQPIMPPPPAQPVRPPQQQRPSNPGMVPPPPPFGAQQPGAQSPIQPRGESPLRRMPPSPPPVRQPAIDEFEDHGTFELQSMPPPMPQSNYSHDSDPLPAPAQANSDDNYGYDYGSIALEPMAGQQQQQPEQSFIEPPQQDAFMSNQIPPAPQQQTQASGKTDLDLEIERYQREIEEKQRRMRGAQPPAPSQHDVPMTQQPQQTAPGPQQQQQFNPPPQQQNYQQPPQQQNDYDVYNMELPAYNTQQPQKAAQPVIGSDDDEAMYFTSVDTDRHKKPLKRPINPRTQQQKGFLSKFFNKDLPS